MRKEKMLANVHLSVATINSAEKRKVERIEQRVKKIVRYD